MATYYIILCNQFLSGLRKAKFLINSITLNWYIHRMLWDSDSVMVLRFILLKTLDGFLAVSF